MWVKIISLIKQKNQTTIFVIIIVIIIRLVFFQKQHLESRKYETEHTAEQLLFIYSLKTVEKKDNHCRTRKYLEMSSSEQRYLLLSLRLSSRAFLASWLSLLTSWIFCSSFLLSVSLSCRWSRNVSACSREASRRPRRSCGLYVGVHCLWCESKQTWLKVVNI